MVQQKSEGGLVYEFHGASAGNLSGNSFILDQGATITEEPKLSDMESRIKEAKDYCQRGQLPPPAVG